MTPTFTPTPTITATSPPATSTPVDPGPRVGYLGIYRSDGCPLGCTSFGCCGGTPTPTPQFENGIQVFSVVDPRAGMIVVEGYPRPGSTSSVGTNLNPIPNSADRPDLQIEADMDIGNGSTTVCDQGPAPLGGGVPAIQPPSFAEGDQTITDTLQDFACRFGVFAISSEACTKDAQGTTSFVTASSVMPSPTPKGIVQFCKPADTTETFPPGDTLLTVQLRDQAGQLGPTAQIIVRIPTPTPTP